MSMSFFTSVKNEMFCVFLLLYNTINTSSFVIQDTYDDLLNDNADYKIDLLINKDDYEMINLNKLTRQFDNMEKKFSELNKLVNKKYNEHFKTKRDNIKYRNRKVTTGTTVKKGDLNTIRTTYATPVTKHVRNKRSIHRNDEVEYSYDLLVAEYNDVSVREAESNETYRANKSDTSKYVIMDSLKEILSIKLGRKNCTENDVKGIGLKAIKCLWDDYKAQRRSSTFIRKSLWRIIKIWFLVYLAMAVPLWCTRGWCCCCLFCKFFKPQKTINEAKKYISINPPGVLKTKCREVQYDPTEREKQSYEEFEHFLRTL